MKKVLFFLIAILTLSFSAMAENRDVYTVDDSAIEQIFAEATDVTISDVQFFGSQVLGTPEMPGNQMQIVANPNPWGAWAICWFLGEFGIHRHYLGTSKPMWLYYTLTCGGIFGVVTIVDWVVLLVGAIQDDISSYCNNDSFFMWL